MVSLHFDPFRNRLARDIRNSLSRLFLQAIAEKDASIFRQAGSNYLQENLEPVYEGYVRDRLKKYEEAFAIIESEPLGDILSQAEIFWDLGLYFEMHELLEIEWKEAEGERRRALQGLIRAAGMKIHSENNNMRAAVSMGTKAQTELLANGQWLSGFKRMAAVLEEIKQTLSSAM